MAEHDHPDNRAELNGLSTEDRLTGARLAAMQPDDFEIDTPPPTLWNQIAAARRGELEHRAAVDGHPVLGGAHPAVAAHPADTDPEPAATAPRRTRRRRLVAAAAAVAALAVGATIAVVRTSDSTENTVLASASLSGEGLDGAPPDLLGSAVVEQSGSKQVLRVEIGDAGAGSGRYLELWLIRTDISGMVSLGSVQTDGTYDLPVGLQIDEYPIVDVSTESYDGNPAHSGRSLLRGQLARA